LTCLQGYEDAPGVVAAGEFRARDMAAVAAGMRDEGAAGLLGDEVTVAVAAQH